VPKSIPIQGPTIPVPPLPLPAVFTSLITSLEEGAEEEAAAEEKEEVVCACVFMLEKKDFGVLKCANVGSSGVDFLFAIDRLAAVPLCNDGCLWRVRDKDNLESSGEAYVCRGFGFGFRCTKLETL
jgi:hypothetical protein